MTIDTAAGLAMAELDTRISDALEIISAYGGIDGAHHKQYVLDQVVRILTGCPTVKRMSKYAWADGQHHEIEILGESEAYLKWCREYSGDPDDEDNYYGEWDEGIAP